MIKTAAIFGAGPVGKSLAHALKSSGFDVILVDKENIESETYFIQTSDVKIDCKFESFKISDELVKDVLDKKMLMFTAMRPENLEEFFNYVSKFLNGHKLKIFTCENAINIKSPSNIIISHILADMICYHENANVHSTPLKFVVEDLDLIKLLNPKYFILRDNFAKAFYQRLYTHNTLHAVVACLGYLKGYVTVYDAIRDKQIHAIAKEALKEASFGIVHKYSISPVDQDNYVKEELALLELKYMRDPIVRVARDPLRKISSEERIIGPLLLCKNAGQFPKYLSLILAGTLSYDYENDSQAVTLQNEIKAIGPANVLKKYSQLKDDALIAKIVSFYKELEINKDFGGVVL
jgi:hypothetical protein